MPHTVQLPMYNHHQIETAQLISPQDLGQIRTPNTMYPFPGMYCWLKFLIGRKRKLYTEQGFKIYTIYTWLLEINGIISQFFFKSERSEFLCDCSDIINLVISCPSFFFT